jgi:hypothetical protein
MLGEGVEELSVGGVLLNGRGVGGMGLGEIFVASCEALDNESVLWDQVFEERGNSQEGGSWGALLGGKEKSDERRGLVSWCLEAESSLGRVVQLQKMGRRSAVVTTTEGCEVSWDFGDGNVLARSPRSSPSSFFCPHLAVDDLKLVSYAYSNLKVGTLTTEVAAL